MGLVLMRPSVPPAGGSPRPAAGAVRVDRAEEGQSLAGGDLGVLAESAGVAAVAERTGRDAELLRPGDQQTHESVRLHLAKAPAAVGRDRRRGLVKHFQAGTGLERAVLDEPQVLRDAHHPVRVVPAQVGVY